MPAAGDARGPDRPRTGAEMRELADHSRWRHADPRRAHRRRRHRAPRSNARFRPDTEIVDAGGRIVLPGFVDAHTHPVFAGTRADEFEQRARRRHVRRDRGRRRRHPVHRPPARAPPPTTRCWPPRAATRSGSCAAAPPRSRPNRATASRSTPKSRSSGRIRAARTPSGRLRYVPTFLGAHEIPDEYRGRTDDYVDLVIHEMLPRVVGREPRRVLRRLLRAERVSRADRRAPIAARRAGARPRPAHACRSVQRAITARCWRPKSAPPPPIIWSAPPPLGSRRLQRAGVQPVLLPASVYNLGSTHYPAARAHDRSRPAGGAGHRFQSRARRPRHPCRWCSRWPATHMKMTPAEAHHGGDHQRRLQPGPRPRDRFARNPARPPISRFTIATTIASCRISSAANRRTPFTWPDECVYRRAA